MSDQSRTQKPLSEVERIKAASNYLRGTIQQGLADPVTGAVAEEDAQLLKFHGTYQQDDRDLRVERSRQKLEPAYAFMVRVRVPGGICTPAQWLYIDELARSYANGSLRLTTRQTFQLHGVLKRNLRETIATINAGLLDTIAACGDVNRNVMCNPNPYQSAIHKDVYAWAKRISTHLLPKTRAYHEIWLDGQPVAGGEDSEPLYGKTYLPRKFKTAIAVPPRNDVDVYAHDLGFIAIVEKGKLTGFNISVGGGLGMTHSDPATYPRLADVIGFCQPEQVLAVAEQVIAVQRDHGERSNRKHARLKYTIEDCGIDWFKSELQTRLGWPLPPPRPFHFDSTGDRLGWVKGTNGKEHFTLFIQNGRIKDSEDYLLMTALREIAAIHTGDFRLTPNQNLIIGNITSHQKPRIQALLESHRLNHNSLSGLRLNSMACVALPSCGLAMAESERYLPDLVTQLEKIMAEAGLQEDPIVIRMTGCPNGCARPYIAEIGLVGKTLGRYNLYLGAGFAGERLNKLYRENAAEADILEALTPLIHHYARERGKGERFGDFVIRTGYVKAVCAGREFHS